MEPESRRKGPRSPSADSDDSSHRRRSRKYDRDRSPSPRRPRYRRSRSRDRRSDSRERRRKESNRAPDWNKPTPQNQSQPTTNAGPGYVPPVHNQYQAPPPPNTSQPPPPIQPYNQGYNYNYNYNQGYDYGYQQPTGYRSDYPPPNWQGGQVPYNNQPTQPPPAMAPTPEAPRPVEPAPPDFGAVSRPEDAKKEAIAAEMKQQQATLSKQREEYVKKTMTLQRELEILRQQCDEIGKEGGRENNRIVKENQKLQVEIQTKMKSIHNVIDMLTGIIGDKATVDELKNKFKSDLPLKRSRSPKEEFPKAKVMESPDKSSGSDTERDSKNDRKSSRIADEDKPIYNFVHYDPEMHWCKVCDIFPKTAKEYLNHLHSNEHKEACLERKIVDMPWHKRNGEGTEKEVPYYPGLPTKRTPIKGLQFFSPATAWYCKLCDSWIGDLHCASLHLKSKRHSENYSRFVDQNPHWETDWMADREKAFSEERQKQMQMELQKQKEDEPSTKPKKSKKSKKNKKKSKKRKNKSSNSDSTSDSDNSESESDQDTSKSIRVAMRNKMKSSTQAILNEEIDYHGIKLKGHWVTGNKSLNPEAPSQENDDRQLLNSIRDKLKAKQEEEMKSRRISSDQMQVEPEDDKYAHKPDLGVEAWGPKEPPKSFWIKKDEEKQPIATKQVDIPKPEEMPKPHMGFWTKQQVNMTVKPHEKSSDKEDDRDRDRDRHKDDRDRKYDRRDDKYHSRYDNYDRRRGRDRDRDRDRDYYDDRRKDRRGDDSPRRDRGWRDSPKRGYDKYKDRRDDESNDESKYDKKSNDSKTKKGQAPMKKQTPQSNKGKLPFIGRLPLFKKKGDDLKGGEKDITPLPYTQSKFEDTPKVPSEIINPPGVVHITKLATPVTMNNSVPPAKTQQSMKILVAPPPPVLNSNASKTSAVPAPATGVVDMEIEDQSEDTIIEEPTTESAVPKSETTENSNSKIEAPSVTTGADTANTNVFAPSRPPPFIPTNPPPFVQNPPRYPVRPPTVTMSTYTHPPPMQTAYVQAPTPMPPMIPMETPIIDGTEVVPEPEKRSTDPSTPLPEDLQEALNIIFPKDEAEAKKEAQLDNHIMYATMYSSMLGCVGYGPEYMDQPPPEITQADTETDTQPGPDDLKMLGIDEGDTIF
ncbi:zinc finger matrin-type protein CG9776-like [Chelonus insularis]|uniref:zinc finger matrin-type protein CG9776-like n=1 Tax=Chelonus insularis TaxID=460826 RepID=UPI00158924D2|nr:zinc finger matrin-type protein CG9776-like [Chelonus insularis]